MINNYSIRSPGPEGKERTATGVKNGDGLPFRNNARQCHEGAVNHWSEWAMRLIGQPGLRFIVTSGLGWSIDFALFSALSFLFPQTPFVANLVSASAAATFVFAISYARIFQRGGDDFFVRLSRYLLFQLFSILISSMLIAITAAALAKLNLLEDGWLAMIAKIIVTPLSLLANFFVARHIIERR
jgi:putative flippase GtrA